jgi:ferric-dicitrate binding protein FerR (iron transport regulator)
MSEDRLEQALDAMRAETASDAELSAAHARVWERLQTPTACSEFRPVLRDYLDGRMIASRRLLAEDHLGRCPRCRAALAELRGEHRVVPVAPRRAVAWPRWGTWAAAAAILVGALWLGRDRIDALLAPGGPRATVASLNGTLHRVAGGLLQQGATVADSEPVRTGPGTRAVLRLDDGSLVEINERTEVLIRGAWSGATLQLDRGDIIVTAAKQRRGHLRVQTRDSVAAVKGTVFAVSAGLRGTLVSVVEGAVAVAQPGVDVLLSPGQQAASNPALAQSVQAAVSWSPDADKYLSLLASFARIERGIGALSSTALRTDARLLQYLPDEVFVFGAVPNLGGTIDEAKALADLEAVQSPVFREWWDSGPGTELRGMIDRVQTVLPMLGAEVAFGFAKPAAGARDAIPMVIAEVRAGREADLTRALDALRAEASGAPLSYYLKDTLLVASDSSDHLTWFAEHAGRGSASPFAAAIADRYRRGAGWLVAVDMAHALAALSAPRAVEIAGAQDIQHVFFEQRNVQGADENEVTLTFGGPRAGLASWLASTGSGGAAEYISSNAIVSFYAATREPRQLFDEVVAQLGRLDPAKLGDLSLLESKLGISLSADLAAALGTETAFGLESFSVAGPVWEMAVLVNDATTLDRCITRIVEAFNAELGPEQQGKRIEIVRERVDGRDWIRLQSGAWTLGVTWTYDRGYMVAASDRGAALRAIAARSGGSALVWSAGFRQQLPASGGVHPSGFIWLNTKGALQGLEGLVTNPTIRNLVAERDPILVAFDGTTEQISAASRTRWTGVAIDLLMLHGLRPNSLGPSAPKSRRIQSASARAGTP